VAIFFSFLILFGVFFVLNLFLAVISDSYAKVQQDQENEEFEEEAKAKKVTNYIKRIKINK
jgi:preprotein translocase subunit SecG